ncbi:hypothetical protein V6Z12_A03G108300 [Gossypium hirsutum]
MEFPTTVYPVIHPPSTICSTSACRHRSSSHLNEALLTLSSSFGLDSREADRKITKKINLSSKFLGPGRSHSPSDQHGFELPFRFGSKKPWYCSLLPFVG